MHKYEEQLERVRRYHRRLQRMYEGQTYLEGNEELVDDVYAFFLNCYHLKDWLKYDSQYTAHSRVEIENYVTNTPSLALCADICNSLKHLSLSHTRSGAMPSFKGTHMVVDFGDDWRTVQSNPDVPVVTLRVNLEHAGAPLDALEVANEAVDAWQQLIGSTPNSSLHRT